MNIQNQIVLITGSNRGIGLALAQEFARRKAHLHLVARHPEKINEIELRKLGAASVRTWGVELGSAAAIDAFYSRFTQEFSGVDILVNNAGLLTGGLLETQAIDSVYQMMQVNLLATFHLSRLFLPHMLTQKRGKIINNASVSGVMFLPCASTYAAAKAGVVALTESLQSELTGTGVSTLLLITPGVETDMFAQIPDMYGENLKASRNIKSMPAKVWAQKVCDAVESDAQYCKPGGSTAVVLKLARHFPNLFYRIVRSQFKR